MEEGHTVDIMGGTVDGMVDIMGGTVIIMVDGTMVDGGILGLR